MMTTVRALASAALVAALALSASAARPATPQAIAETAVRAAYPQLMTCVAAPGLRAAARLRLKAGGATEVVRIVGVSDPRARACLRTWLSAIAFNGSGEVVVPLDLRAGEGGATAR